MISRQTTNSQKLILVALIGFGFWVFYPALSLPCSFIDDLPLIESGEMLINGIKNGNFIQVLSNHVSITEKIYNLGFWFIIAFKYNLTGNQPYHWIKLFELFLVCMGLFKIISLATQKRSGWFISSIIGVLVFIIAEVPYTVDMQSLRANWYRLHSSDADVLPWLVLLTISYWKFADSILKRKPNYFWTVGVIAGGVLSFTIKIPMIAVTAILVLMGGVSFFVRQRKLAVHSIILAITILICFCVYYYTLTYIPVGKVKEETYASAYKISYDAFKGGLLYYYNNYVQMLGPGFLIVLVLSIYSIINELYVFRKNPSDYNPRIILLTIFFLTWFIGFSSLYFCWPSHIPRYMLVGYFGFAALVGILYFQIARGLLLIKYKKPILFLAILPGLFIPLLPYNTCLVLLAALGAAELFMRKKWFSVAISTSLSVTIITMGIIGCFGRNAIVNYYVEFEKSNYRALIRIIEYSKAGKNIYFNGEIGNEVNGCMTGFAHRMGGNFNMLPIEKRISPSADDIIVVNFYTSPNWKEYAGRDVPVFEIGIPNHIIKAPADFEVIRKNILNRHNPIFWTPFQFDFIWRFYNK